MPKKKQLKPSEDTNYWNTQEFKELEKKWYEKLKNKPHKEGKFRDIELKNGALRDDHMKAMLLNPHQVVWEAKQTYYQMTTAFLEEYKFDNKLDKIIWEYHSNGISYRDITKILAKIRINRSRTWVYFIIKKLKASMWAMYMAPKTEYHE